MRLLPSLRERKRYVVIEAIAEKKFSFLEIKEALEHIFHSFWGILGMAKAAPQLVKEKWNPATQRFIIKVSHITVDELKAALLLSKRIKNTPLILRSISVSGTLKQAGSYLEARS